ncbi:sodium:calcium antiporter [Halorussus gelatinilyticus]|uniref:Sodium:calcium antiporter n=1 Tax=Halorussus gelatinilyticus TaxID=2937524 RepID=A0A8U0IG21_9EURY|nr:sodium:calcium antiporter [Halorussus gelatinilyticus]UPV99161.1 sodium:calcium antiporter [Halorussus gelatinilyticus]
MLSRLRHPLAAVGATTALTLPWVFVWATGSAHSLGDLQTVALSGLAVLGASFMLAWAAETAEKDVPRAFALAVLAVLAVAPEYAVDALYAWQAGANAGTALGADKANLAVANMTGANRILIGLGWSGIALFTVYRSRSSEDPAVVQTAGFMKSKVRIDRDLATEIAFLLAATAYAFFVPLGHGIGMLDTVVLVSLYAIYIGIVIRGEIEEHEEQVGVPGYFQSLPKLLRIASVLLMFSYSGAMIYTAVHPFAEGLEHLGTSLGIPPFFMIQWIAPLASESPELIVVAYLVNKARSTAGFNALISSKLNQWTLLIGTLAVVYSIAAGSIGALPFDEKQQAEIWITAAQSFFALGVLANFEISVREAVVLLVLFVSQVVAEFWVIQTMTDPQAHELSMLILYAYTAVYVVLGVGLFVTRRDELRAIFDRTAANARNALPGGSEQVEHAD